MASVDVLAERLKGSSSRPLLRNGDTREAIRSLLDKRMYVYEKVEHRIDTDLVQPEAIAHDIVRIYRSRTADV